MAFASLVFLALLSVVSATPTLQRRQSLVSTTTMDSFTPYSHYAGAAYCGPTAVSAWDCGAPCSANPTFQPVAAGGDGDSVQYWYVGYDPKLNTIIVGHQGTNASNLLPVLEDGDAILGSLDTTLYPGMSSAIEVDKGFATAQAAAALDVLSGVQTALSAHPSASVTVVGHSLGASIALLDSVFFKLQLEAGVDIITITYSMPRVGNQDFANWVDANLKLTHITNEKDPIPICPGRFLDYVHPSGEIHIYSGNGEWYACPGQDNPSQYCIVGDVPNIFDGDTSDHDGPFNGITIGSGVCS